MCACACYLGAWTPQFGAFFWPHFAPGRFAVGSAERPEVAAFLGTLFLGVLQGRSGLADWRSDVPQGIGSDPFSGVPCLGTTFEVAPRADHLKYDAGSC